MKRYYLYIVCSIGFLSGIVFLKYFMHDTLIVSEKQLQTTVDEQLPKVFQSIEGIPSLSFSTCFINLTNNGAEVVINYSLTFQMFQKVSTRIGAFRADADISYREDKVYLTNLKVAEYLIREDMIGFSKPIEQALNTVFGTIPIYNLRKSKDIKIKSASLLIKNVDTRRGSVTIYFIN